MDKLFALVVVGGIILVGAIFWFFWWLTGVALDWANVRFALGLSGTPLFVAHIILFLILSSLGGGSVSSSRRD